MNRLLPVIAILLLFSSALLSQNYIPIDTANLSVREGVSRDYMIFSKQFAEKVRNQYKGSERTYIGKSFSNLQKDFNEDILNGEYIFDNRFSSMIGGIVNELKSKNPSIPSSLQLFISKDLSLNASSMGDSTFVINLGTFTYLENEDELAAIISHEIGHLILNHTAIILELNYKTEKIDSKKQLSESTSEKYDRGEKALNRLKKILYTGSNLRRLQEQAADSMGYILFNNTKYKHSDYINAFQLIADYDSLKIDGLKTETYRKIFNLPTLSFKENWLKNEDFSTYEYSKLKELISSDSLKSHPESKERISHLKLLFPELDYELKSAEPTPEYAMLKQIALNEQSPCLYHQEAFGEGIYLCLLKLQKDSADQYSRKWLGIFFQKIYDARKSYTLNRYLDRVQPREQSESYMQFLNFMWNLNLNDLKLISSFYNI
jgi:hypothetical protein